MRRARRQLILADMEQYHDGIRRINLEERKQIVRLYEIMMTGSAPMTRAAEAFIEYHCEHLAHGFKKSDERFLRKLVDKYIAF